MMNSDLAPHLQKRLFLDYQIQEQAFRDYQR